MSTEVVHGPDPKFKAELQPYEFWCEVVGRYTTTPDLAAAGVQDHKYASARPEKRHAELLVLRTAFLHWWLQEWRANGGTSRDAYGHVWGIINSWR